MGVNLFGQDTIRFEKALLIQSGIDYNRTSLQYDPLAFQILTQSIETPVEGAKLNVEGEDDGP